MKVLVFIIVFVLSVIATATTLEVFELRSQLQSYQHSTASRYLEQHAPIITAEQQCKFEIVVYGKCDNN